MAQKDDDNAKRAALRVPLTLESSGWIVGGAVAALSALAAGGSWLDAHIDDRVERHLRHELILIDSRMDAIEAKAVRLDGRLNRLESRISPLWFPAENDEAIALGAEDTR